MVRDDPGPDQTLGERLRMLEAAGWRATAADLAAVAEALAGLADLRGDGVAPGGLDLENLVVQGPDPAGEPAPARDAPLVPDGWSLVLAARGPNEGRAAAGATSGHAPPEATVGPASDVYAATAIIHRIASGTPSAARPWLPPRWRGLATWCSQGLSADPGQRPATPDQWLEGLRASLVRRRRRRIGGMVATGIVVAMAVAGAVPAILGDAEPPVIAAVAVGSGGVVLVDAEGRTSPVPGGPARSAAAALDSDGRVVVVEDLVTATGLHEPGGMAIAADRSVYVADTGHHRIVRVLPDGALETVAGGGNSGFAGDDGPARSARLDRPTGLALGGDGSVYVADTGNRRVRRIAPDGTIRTVAGSGAPGSSGDGGPAVDAHLSKPVSVAVGTDGSVWIADAAVRRVRRVDPDGVIATVAQDLDGPLVLVALPAGGVAAVAPGGSTVLTDSRVTTSRSGRR